MLKEENVAHVGLNQGELAVSWPRYRNIFPRDSNIVKPA
jgi:hypothetical protein